MNFQQLWPSLETYLKLFAYVAAAAFFLWKAFTGWLIINLSVSITTERQHTAAGQDWLVLRIELDKGATDALWLKDIQARIRHYDGDQLVKDFVIPFPEIQRPTMSGETIQWEDDDSGKTLTLSPGEKAQFAQLVQVNRSNVCRVDVVVRGSRTFWKDFVWRASAISLPLRAAFESDTTH